MDNDKLNKFKKLIKAYLSQDNYALFIETITKADINYDNYVSYLDTIKEVMQEKFKEQDPFEITSKDKLEEVIGMRKKEKTFIEWLPDLNSAIVIIFERKLNVKRDVKYEDNEIKQNLENFKERFM